MNLQCTKNLVAGNKLIMAQDVVYVEKIQQSIASEPIYKTTILISKSVKEGYTLFLSIQQIAEHFQYCETKTCYIKITNVSIPNVEDVIIR